VRRRSSEATHSITRSFLPTFFSSKKTPASLSASGRCVDWLCLRPSYQDSFFPRPQGRLVPSANLSSPRLSLPGFLFDQNPPFVLTRSEPVRVPRSSPVRGLYHFLFLLDSRCRVSSPPPFRGFLGRKRSYSIGRFWRLGYRFCPRSSPRGHSPFFQHITRHFVALRTCDLGGVPPLQYMTRPRGAALIRRRV